MTKKAHVVGRRVPPARQMDAVRKQEVPAPDDGVIEDLVRLQRGWQTKHKESGIEEQVADFLATVYCPPDDILAEMRAELTPEKTLIQLKIMHGLLGAQEVRRGARGTREPISHDAAGMSQVAGEFYFECPLDGTYRVSEETLRLFIAPRHKEELDDRLTHGAAGAKLQFEGGCPRCEPNRTHTVTVVALRRQIN
jgi:hypothetical protein